MWNFLIHIAKNCSSSFLNKKFSLHSCFSFCFYILCPEEKSRFHRDFFSNSQLDNFLFFRKPYLSFSLYKEKNRKWSLLPKSLSLFIIKFAICLLPKWIQFLSGNGHYGKSTGSRAVICYLELITLMSHIFSRFCCLCGKISVYNITCIYKNTYL